MREVGGGGPGAKLAEPEIVQAPAQAVPKLQQAGADVAPVVSAEGHTPDCPPRVDEVHPMVLKGRDDVVPLWAGLFRGS